MAFAVAASVRSCSRPFSVVAESGLLFTHTDSSNGSSPSSSAYMSTKKSSAVTPPLRMLHAKVSIS